jgi:predicted secreted Zn-dependent protease
MLGALRGHENHHVSIAETHMEGLRTALANIHEDDLATVWREKMQALQDAQDAYDTSTTNGQTEGVTLNYGIGQPDAVEDEESTEEIVGVGEDEW